MSVRVSVCIPCYEMNGFGVTYLRQNLSTLSEQTFQDFEVVISDHSMSDDIERLCQTFSDRLRISYVHFDQQRGNSSANINNAMRQAKGQLIKILFQDDFLASPTALQTTVDAFDLEHDHWLVSACQHTADGQSTFKPLYPTYNNRIHLGENTISSPSVVTVKNDGLLFFDEHLVWLMDCDYYKRYHDTYGPPQVLNTITVVNRIGAHQVSNTSAHQLRRISEELYVRKKFRERLPLSLVLRYGLAALRQLF